MTNIEKDKIRYGKNKKMPRFQYYYRKYHIYKGGILGLIYKFLCIREQEKKCNDMPVETKIGGGLYFGHATGITINSHAIIGSNCNIHKGVTIGRENRGKRKGTPVIGDEVWIGINATIVGGIKIGNDVLIAPNSFVNFDVPDHSIVLGNPGKVIPRENATEGYINNKCNVAPEVSENPDLKELKL